LPGIGIVLLSFPPASIFPFIDIACTERHACKPPFAATFLLTISSAEGCTAGAGEFAAVPKGIANDNMKVATQISRNIDDSL
jgi:hypothetical protein